MRLGLVHRLAPPFTMRASSISAGMLDMAEDLRGDEREIFSKLTGRDPRPGNRSLWTVTVERVREGNSFEGDDMASTTGRSRDILATYARCEHNFSEAGQSCQKFLKRVGAAPGNLNLGQSQLLAWWIQLPSA
jgi:hypothetical protein